MTQSPVAGPLADARRSFGALANGPLKKSLEHQSGLGRWFENPSPTHDAAHGTIYAVT